MSIEASIFSLLTEKFGGLRNSTCWLSFLSLL
jgi:hypothetical protein